MWFGAVLGWQALGSFTLKSTGLRRKGGGYIFNQGFELEESKRWASQLPLWVREEGWVQGEGCRGDLQFLGLQLGPSSPSLWTKLPCVPFQTLQMPQSHNILHLQYSISLTCLSSQTCKVLGYLNNKNGKQSCIFPLRKGHLTHI